MSVKLTLEGVQESIERIKKYQVDLFQAVDSATQEAAFFIEREAKLMAPVNTGRLRASIHPEVEAINTTKGSVTVTVSDLVDYGLYVEFKHPTKAGFFRRAGDLAKKEYPDLVISKVQKVRSK